MSRTGIVLSLIALLVLSSVIVSNAHAASSPTPARVLVVYNANWPQDSDGDGVKDSLQVANYYVAKRGVPAANVLGLSCTNDGGGSTFYYYYTGEYAKFHSEVITPIKNKLAALGPTNIDVILFCYGVPNVFYDANSQTLSVDNTVIALNYWNGTGSDINTSGYPEKTNPYLEPTPTFGTDKGHFDHATYKYSGTEMYLVSRVDGPRGLNGAMDMIDQALYGDRYVSATAGYYNGNAYVDSRFGQGGGGTKYTDAYLTASSNVTTGNYWAYQAGDENMAYAEHYVPASGFTLKWENTTGDAEIGEAGATFSDSTSGLTAPRALFYGGWYNYAKSNDVFDWLPGSVACDLNSNSLFRIRDTSSVTFGVRAVSRGASCVSGVIDEPYLNGHPRPNILLYYMLQGYTWAEASMLGTPDVGWREVSLGDPLYAPLRSKTLVKDTQFPVLASGSPTAAAASTTCTIKFMVSDSPEPEVVKAQLDYGTTTSYGTSVNSGEGYWRRHSFALSGLVAGTLYHYRLILTDPVGNVTTTGDFTFSTATGTAPAITTQPGNQTVNAGQTATFSVVATGTGPLSYMWCKNGVGIGGATSSSYTTPATTLADNGAIFTVVVSNGSGKVTSNNATLTVNPAGVAPSITTQPANQTVTVGQTATFSVVASGTPTLSYQWRKNGTNITGANSASYTTPATVAGNNGALFSVYISNSYGNVTSNDATLTVGIPPSITTQPANKTVTVGQTATFSVVAAGTATLSYQWRKNGTNITGANSASYTTPATVAGDNGALFSVYISNSYGNVTSNNATLTVGIPPAITVQPPNRSVIVGNTATFTVTATGTATLSYQWRKNGTNIPGATAASYTTPATVLGDSGARFSVYISNSYGNVTSNNATLTVTTVGVPASIVTQPVAALVNVGQMATFSVLADGTDPLTYQWRKNGVNISGATSAAYTTPATVLADDGALFSVYISNSYGNVTSNNALLSVNTLPVLNSMPVATPNPALTGQVVTFTAAAADPDPLTYAWTFGDGATGSGATATHIYTAAGTYTATVTVDDGRGGTTSGTVQVTVNVDAGGGAALPGLDSDDDGVSDAQEALDGTDPLDPTSVKCLPLTVLKMQGSVKFNTTGQDSFSVSGKLLNMPAGFVPTTVSAILNVGGAKSEFVLDAKGKARNGQGSLALSLKPSLRDKATKKLNFLGGDVAFKVKLAHGNWRDVWANEGVDPTADKTNVPLNITVNLQINGTLYGVYTTATYSSKAGKFGKFKK